MTERDPAGTLTGAAGAGGATGAKGDEIEEQKVAAGALKCHGDSWLWTDLALPPVPPGQSSTAIRFLLFLLEDGIPCWLSWSSSSESKI